MDSSYMNSGRMSACSACSCNQSRRMDDGRHMDDGRCMNDGRRMNDSRRMNDGRRMDDGRRMNDGRRMDDGRCMDDGGRMDSGRCMDDRRHMEESSCVGKSELCEKADGLALAMAYVPWQCYQDTFDLCKGLHMGTIFPELCKPFCGKRGVCQC